MRKGCWSTKLENLVLEVMEVVIMMILLVAMEYNRSIQLRQCSRATQLAQCWIQSRTAFKKNIKLGVAMEQESHTVGTMLEPFIKDSIQ